MIEVAYFDDDFSHCHYYHDPFVFLDCPDVPVLVVVVVLVVVAAIVRL